MDTDMQANNLGEHVVDGSLAGDYTLSFESLLNMVDKTLDDYKMELS